MSRYVWQNVEHKLPIDVNSALTNLNSATNNLGKLLTIPENAANSYSDTEFAKILLANSTNPTEYNKMLQAFSTGSGLSDQQQVLRRNLSATAIENAFNKLPQVMENAKAFNNYIANKNMEYEVREHGDLVNSFRNAIESGDTGNATRYLNQLSKVVSPETFNAIKQNVVAVKQANANVAKTWADTGYTNSLTDTNIYNLDERKKQEQISDLVKVLMANSGSREGATVRISELVQEGKVPSEIGAAAILNISQMPQEQFNKLGEGASAVDKEGNNYRILSNNSNLSSDSLGNNTPIESNKNESTSTIPGNNSQMSLDDFNRLMANTNTNTDDEDSYNIAPDPESVKAAKIKAMKNIEYGLRISLKSAIDNKNTSIDSMPKDFKDSLPIPNDVLDKYKGKTIGDIPLVEALGNVNGKGSLIDVGDYGGDIYNSLRSSEKYKNMTIKQYSEMSESEKENFKSELFGESSQKNLGYRVQKENIFKDSAVPDNEKNATTNYLRSVNQLGKDVNDINKLNKSSNGNSLQSTDAIISMTKDLLKDNNLETLFQTMSSNGLGNNWEVLANPELYRKQAYDYVFNVLLKNAPTEGKENMTNAIMKKAHIISKDSGFPIDNFIYTLAFNNMGTPDDDIGESSAVELAKDYWENRQKYIDTAKRQQATFNGLVNSQNAYAMMNENVLNLEAIKLKYIQAVQNGDKSTMKAMYKLLQQSQTNLVQLLNQYSANQKKFIDMYKDIANLNLN